MTECPGCGTTLPVAGARFCHGCGRPLEGGASVPASAVEVTLEAAAPVPQAPAVSDRYEILRFLGEGGTKRVYLARDRRLDREVALGLLKTQQLDSTGRARLEREARAMAALGDHPSIVTLYDIDEVGEQVYIVCQYMDSGSLADRLYQQEGRPLELREALHVAIQVSEALAHAHRTGLVHRDVKPGNVWLKSGGAALLGDFGLAVAADHTRLTTEGSLLGTAGYLPPEQAQGKPPEPASDLYSLGCMLYEMVTGRRPFAGDDALTVISQHLHADPAPPSFHRPELPGGIDQLILELMSKRPEDRPPGAAAVALRLRALAAGDGLAGDGARQTPRTGTATAGFFVGRHEEMARLRSVFEETLGGATRLCMLVGEPGIGKTRMCEELRVFASLRGARVLTGPCYEGDSSVPYLPFAEALRQLCRSFGDRELRPVLAGEAPQIARLVSEVRTRFPDLEEAPRLEGEAERLRLFEAVAAFLRAAAERQPLVLVLEDLHWSDKPTLLLLRHLARRLVTDRVLLLGTYRDVDLDRTHPLSDALATLKRERPYERILLRGFPREEVAELLQAMGGEIPPAGFVEEMWRETEGNPFFVQEIIRHLVEVGAIARRDGRWVGDPAAVRRNLPEGIREVIGRRLSRLSEACNEMLTHASLVSSGFSFELLRAIEDKGENELLDLLDEALEARVLRESERHGVYDFEHALVRQTLAAELSTPRRVRLHRRIGEALERLHADDPDRVLTELAHQFYQAAPAGLEEKAMAYAARAAERAMDAVAYEEAAGHYARALELLEGDGEEVLLRRCRWTLELGDALFRSGEHAAAGERFQDASRWAAEGGLPEITVAAVDRWQMRGFFPGRTNEVQLALVERALAANHEGSDSLRARLAATKAQAIASSPERDAERVELAREAMRLARACGDPAALVAAMVAENLLGEAASLDAGEIAGAVARLDAGAPPRLRLLSRVQLVRRLIEQGRAREATEVQDQFRRLAETLQDPLFLNFAFFMRVLRAQMEGRLEGVRSTLREFQERGFETHDRAMIAVMIQGVLASLEGHPEGVLDANRAITEEYDNVSGLHGMRAISLVEVGRLGEARAVLDRSASAGFDRIPHDVGRQTAIHVLAECTVALDAEPYAAPLYRELSRWAGEGRVAGPNLFYLGSIDAALGGLAALLGRWPQAVEHFERAIALEDSNGARPWASKARVAYARALVRHAGPGDVDRARALLAEARCADEELGIGMNLRAAAEVERELAAAERQP